MKPFVAAVLFAVLILAAATYAALALPVVQDTVATRMIEQQLAKQRHDLFEPDGLRVLLCGTSSPFPHPSRAKACVAIFAAGRFWLIDTGPGSWNTLGELGIDAARVGAVLLTHFHSDHIGDLGELNLQTWAAGRPAPLRVYGPPGVESVVSGFSEAYALDREYRIAHHTASFMPSETSAMEPIVIEEPKYREGPRTVVEQDGLLVTAFPVRHDPVRPAYGYRFEYLGRSVVVSGDTAKTPTLVRVATNADVLVHEALADHIVAKISDVAEEVGRPRVAKIMGDIRDYHTSAVEAAEIANEAGARLLVLTHLAPPPANRIAETIFTRGVDDVRPDGWVLGEDGMLIELPAGSDSIELTQL